MAEFREVITQFREGDAATLPRSQQFPVPLKLKKRQAFAKFKAPQERRPPKSALTPSKICANAFPNHESQGNNRDLLRHRITQQQLSETAEQILAIVRTSGSFGVILNAKRGQSLVLHACDRVVVEVVVSHLKAVRK